MKIRHAKVFVRSYKKLPQAIQKKVDRQILRLAKDIRHPSLHARKMQNTGGVWECRVDYHYRMTFEIEPEVLTLRSVGTHQIYRNIA